MNSCIVWIIGKWLKMNWIYSLSRSFGLNHLIWREIRSKPKVKSKFGLNIQFNLIKNKSQHLFTIEIVFFSY